MEKEFINELISKYKDIKDNQNNIETLRKNIYIDKESIKSTIEGGFIEFINKKLQEAIDKYDLNKGKDDNRYVEIECSSCSTDGMGIKKWISKMENRNSKFIPSEDKWEFVSIEEKDGKYRICVDNIKGHKSITPFCWEPDYFYTDWFEI